MIHDDDDGLEFLEEDDTPIAKAEAQKFSQAVLFSSDWTVETIIKQLERGNIEMNPRFQRRDAWDVRRKSAFIESIVLGLPIPQIVLAERTNQRGRYIVLDGKQRLLSLLQFTGKSEGPANAFALSGLQARSDLTRKKYRNLETDPQLADDLNAFLNHTIRTVVIRNWPNSDFLHLVFLRLNTGSVKLSPQELRQAMVPGAFADFLDEASGQLKELQTLLSREGPDPRMRDVELLVRFLAMRYFLTDYGGRMKSFLDMTTERLSSEWAAEEQRIREAVESFRLAIQTLLKIFGADNVARKPGSRVFNRAIFDALAFYASDLNIRTAMDKSASKVRAAYDATLKNVRFMEAVESDTAGIPHTFERLEIWGQALRKATGLKFALPEMKDSRISFAGLTCPVSSGHP